MSTRSIRQGIEVVTKWSSKRENDNPGIILFEYHHCIVPMVTARLLTPVAKGTRPRYDTPYCSFIKFLGGKEDLSVISLERGFMKAIPSLMNRWGLTCRTSRLKKSFIAFSVDVCNLRLHSGASGRVILLSSLGYLDYIRSRLVPVLLRWTR